VTYPFVAAANDYGPRKGPVLAFVIHMAEGGGTVGFLSRPNQRGVSVHYVIEYSGRIVQMLHETRASGSLNPNDLRTTDGPPPFGASVGKATLGSWWKDPNSAVLSVEIEGFASVGPSDEQKVALRHLVDDIRTRFPDIGLLGHRDFQDYKACPGGYIPWDDIGGHGPAHQEDPMQPFPVALDPKIAAINPGAQLYLFDLTPGIKVSNAPAATSPYGYTTGGVHYRVVQVPTGGVPHLWLVKASDCTLTTVPSVPAGTATVLSPGLYEVAS
jgi:hypothetical protein